MGRLIKTLFAIALLASSLHTLASDDQATALELKQTGTILPLEQILSIARQHLDGRILEVKLEHEHGQYIYELEILDSQDQVWELEIDAQNGQLINKEPD